jgi:hypothetical protein
MVIGTLTRDFHQTTSLGPLIHGIKPFGKWLRICVNDSAISEHDPLLTPIVFV